jgi:predicted ATPase
VNPFSIPGARSISAPPLCPWREDTGEHAEYYVPVDNTQVAFEEFEARLARSDLPHNGWMVLVGGGSGCGKTSLINRCVCALRDHLAARSIKLTIADVRDQMRRTSTIDQRMEWVCEAVVDAVSVRAALQAEQLEKLEEYCDNPVRFYRWLRDALPRDRVIAILLPAAELIDEVGKYVEVSYEKIVFFAETSDDSVASGAARTPESRQAQVTMLKVHPLGIGDGRSFSNDRIKRHDGSGPHVDREAAERMVQARLSGSRPGISIGMLQRLLYEAYEEASGRENPDQVTITYEYLADYVVRSVM